MDNSTEVQKMGLHHGENTSTSLSSGQGYVNDAASTYTTDTKADMHGHSNRLPPHNEKMEMSAVDNMKMEKKKGIRTDNLISAKNIVGYAMSVFVFCGCSSLIHWNFLVQVLPFVQTHYLEDNNNSASYLGLFQLSNMLVQFFMLKYGSRHPKTLMVSSALSCILGLIIAYVFLHPGNITAAIAGLHVAIFILGIFGGFLQGVAFSIASVMPKNMVGFVSIGQGVSGLFAFLVIIALSKGPFNLEKHDDLYKIVWLAFGIAGAVTFVNLILIFILVNHSWAKDALDKMNKKTTKKPNDLENGNNAPQQELSRLNTSNGNNNQNNDNSTNDNEVKKFFNIHDNENNSTTNTNSNDKSASTSTEIDEADAPRRPIMQIIKDAAPHLLICLLSFFTSFHLYPNVGPNLWHYNTGKKSDTLVAFFGIFCVFEFVGRSLPDLSAIQVPCLCMPNDNVHSDSNVGSNTNNDKFKKLRMFKFLMVPLKIFRALVFLRLVIFVPFILAYVYSGKLIINDNWFLGIVMAVHALTQGWYGSLSIIYSTSCVKRLKEREVTAPLTIIFVILGVVIGLFLSEIYKER